MTLRRIADTDGATVWHCVESTSAAARARTIPTCSPTPRGAATGGGLLIEVLVAVLVSAFALLGFAAMQARATTAEFEALQRSQALLLVEDMVARMNANRARAAGYVQAGTVGEGGVVDCGVLNGAALDLCR
ncbi:MAG: hypothetical protein MZW92_27920 [Comamonadaceae bacterium]|nr:hypothetical protein [Comamonadaceae bacterium]